jgi:hypothetical protein
MRKVSRVTVLWAVDCLCFSRYFRGRGLTPTQRRRVLRMTLMYLASGLRRAFNAAFPHGPNLGSANVPYQPCCRFARRVRLLGRSHRIQAYLPMSQEESWETLRNLFLTINRPCQVVGQRPRKAKAKPSQAPEREKMSSFMTSV